MNRDTRIRFRYLCVALGLAIALAAAVGVVGVSSSASSGRAAPSSGLPLYRMDTDHATYPTVPEISNAADTIVNGQVVSHTTEPGESPGVDALGDPLPAIPRTDYLVSVAAVLKGAVSPGSTIHLVLAGGNTEEGEFVLEGAPKITDGEAALFFLVSGGEGRYYPLAGGAAVATRLADGTFLLPPDATGEAAHAISEGEVQTALGSSTGSSGGGGAAAPATVVPAAAPVPRAPSHRVHCRKGFEKKKVKGKPKCVKKRHNHKKRHKHHK
jgi:hypothetical protein